MLEKLFQAASITLLLCILAGMSEARTLPTSIVQQIPNIHNQ
jgi:hypothetical protein